ncbi:MULTISPECIES: hypothetical protein [Streptomyces]|uniref:Uncharacterized protein n=1 Tax=Streptomyces luteosporeus TaxID=173856 RepID=A0ABP6GBP1_9ACTN
MGVLGLHNECPPTNYATGEAAEISEGLVADAVATAATLRAVRDTLDALAALDDTVRYVVEASGTAVSRSGEVDSGAVTSAMKHVTTTYDACFRALDGTVAQIDLAVGKYQFLQSYAAAALAKGRDECYEQTLRTLGEGGFTGMAQGRIARLRKLRVRVQLLQDMEENGRRILAGYDFNAFFMKFMQPMRDLALASQDLYDEVVRGALVAYDTLVRVCDLNPSEAAAAGYAE